MSLTFETLVQGKARGDSKQIYLFLLARAYERAYLLDKAKEAYKEIVEESKAKLAEQEDFFSKRKTKPPRLEMGALGQMAQKELDRLKERKP